MSLIKHELHQSLKDDYLMRHTKDMEHLLANFRKWGMKKVSPDDYSFKMFLYDMEIQIEELKSINVGF